MQIIHALKGRPGIKRILYPFDPDFPQYELAMRQMSGMVGGLFYGGV
jgi:cystathionine beta-lyase/cystathionine gamma-synthase